MGNYVLLNCIPARIYHMALFKNINTIKFLVLLVGIIQLVVSEFEIMQ